MTDRKKNDRRPGETHIIRPVSWPAWRHDRSDDTDVNWRAWAIDMCTLLDRIEVVQDDAAAVQALCWDRFALAKAHNLIVRPGPEVSARDQ